MKSKSDLIRYLIIVLFSILVTKLYVGNEIEASSYIIQGPNSLQVAELVKQAGGTVTSELHIINGVGAILNQDHLTNLEYSPNISAIHPNNQVNLSGKIENNNGSQGVKEKKSKIPSTNYPDVVGADLVWEAGINGEGITVAIVDTGIDLVKGIQEDIHGDKGRVIAWADFIEGKKKPKDKNGHGTHIAGIISNTQIGEDGEWNGIAPGVDLVSVRVLNQDGFGTYESVIQGIQWVIDHKEEFNIRVLNLSLVSMVQSPYWADPLNQAVMQAWANGIVVVVAAGNGGPDPMTIGVPGNIPYVITVGAFTDNYTPYDWSDDLITPFSAAGPTLDGFVKPDIVAPGAHIASLVQKNDTLALLYPETYIAKDYYAIAGTSQSAAVVSGIAALTLAEHPDLTPDQVKYRIMYSSGVWIDLVSTEALYSMWQQGAGRVYAPDAVFSDIEAASANFGMDIWADLAGEVHYQGFSIYDQAGDIFKLLGEYGSWAGGYGSWAGGYGSWAGGYGSWAGGYGSWAGGYGSWAGGYGSWAGGYGSWAGSYGSWAGGYGSWAGGYGSWAGSEPWVGSIYWDPEFVENFLAGTPPNASTTDTSISIQP
jgi:serine protease AprX